MKTSNGIFEFFGEMAPKLKICMFKKQVWIKIEAGKKLRLQIASMTLVALYFKILSNLSTQTEKWRIFLLLLQNRNSGHRHGTFCSRKINRRQIWIGTSFRWNGWKMHTYIVVGHCLSPHPQRNSQTHTACEKDLFQIYVPFFETKETGIIFFFSFGLQGIEKTAQICWRNKSSFHSPELQFP